MRLEARNLSLLLGACPRGAPVSAVALATGCLLPAYEEVRTKIEYSQFLEIFFSIWKFFFQQFDMAVIIFLIIHFHRSLQKYQSEMDCGEGRSCLRSTAVDSPTSLGCPVQ
jgi:hypothetical protein